MSRFIYRVIREDEDISEGIMVGCRTPAANEREILDRLRYHIQNGSNESYTEKFFISMTEKFEVTHKYRRSATNKKSRVVLIDREAISQDVISLSNLEETFARNDTALVKKAKNYTQADSELLTAEDIVPEQFKEISPLMFDIFDAINSSIAKDNPESNREREMLEFLQTVYFDSTEFETILQEPTELDVYEHYFFENYYQQGKSIEEILSEMNNAIAQNGGKPIDLSVLESLRVSTLKKLINSDKTLEYLKRYNEEKYKSEEISSQLDEAMSEKESEKRDREKAERKDVDRYKYRYLTNIIKKYNEKIAELREKISQYKKQHAELYEKYEQQNSRKKNAGFRETLEAGVNPQELTQKMNQILETEKELKICVSKRDIYEKMLDDLRSSRLIDVKSNSRKIASKYQGLTLRGTSGRAYYHYERPTERQVKTTAVSSRFKEMENSSGCIAIGETAYIDVSREEELIFTEGIVSAIGIDKKGTILTTISSKWEKKAIGNESNSERIGKRKYMTAVETGFGLEELSILSRSHSRELIEKIDAEKTRYSAVIQKVKEEVPIDFANRCKKRVIS